MAVLVLAPVIACGGAAQVPDAGSAIDAGAVVDAGAADGGRAADSGAPRDTRCDDGSKPTCPGLPTVCPAPSIVAVQGSCWACVNPLTCLPWGEPGCKRHDECAPTERCDPCATSSCPACLDCVAACYLHGCPSEDKLMCFCARPDCNGGYSVIRNGCWQCVTPASCSPYPGGC